MSKRRDAVIRALVRAGIAPNDDNIDTAANQLDAILPPPAITAEQANWLVRMLKKAGAALGGGDAASADAIRVKAAQEAEEPSDEDCDLAVRRGEAQKTIVAEKLARRRAEREAKKESGKK